MIGLLEVRGFGRVRLVVDVPALSICVPLKNWGEIVELRRRDGARSSDEKGGSACCGAGDAWLTVMFIASGRIGCERTRRLLGGSPQVNESAKIWPGVSLRKNPRCPARSLPREKGKRRDDQLLAPGRAGTITLARIKLDHRKDPE